MYRLVQLPCWRGLMIMMMLVAMDTVYQVSLVSLYSDSMVEIITLLGTGLLKSFHIPSTTEPGGGGTRRVLRTITSKCTAPFVFYPSFFILNNLPRILRFYGCFYDRGSRSSTRGGSGQNEAEESDEMSRRREETEPALLFISHFHEGESLSALTLQIENRSKEILLFQEQIHNIKKKWNVYRLQLNGAIKLSTL